MGYFSTQWMMNTNLYHTGFFRYGIFGLRYFQYNVLFLRMSGRHQKSDHCPGYSIEHHIVWIDLLFIGEGIV
jgi:hypothetical protein